MAKDKRLFMKLALDFLDHPKIAILSDTAFRCLVEAMLWSRKQERSGLLPRRYAVARWSLDALQELCCNDDTNPSLVEHDEGWYIHDYAEHQETKADIDARRERNRIAGQKGGLAKAKRSAKRPASKVLSETLSENLADTDTDKDKDKEQKTCATSSRDCLPPRFEEFWSAYPRRRDRRKAEKAFTTALKRADADTIIAGAHRYANDPNRAEQYTKYAEGWLNGDGWLDEPLPSRNGHGPSLSTADLRVAQAQALKSVPSHRLELQ